MSKRNIITCHKDRIQKNHASARAHADASFFSPGGDCDCFVGGERDETTRTSAGLPRVGGESDARESTCILSSRSPFGDGAVSVGDSVAIGGSAIATEAAEAACACGPAPIGRGWGGSTAGSDGLGGNGSRASGECDAGCVRNGIGEGRVDGSGVRLPDGDEIRRLIISTRVRLLLLLSWSSGPGLSARLSGPDDPGGGGGDAWCDDTELRCDGGGRGDGSLNRLCAEIVGECDGASGPLAEPSPRYPVARPMSVFATPSS